MVQSLRTFRPDKIDYFFLICISYGGGGEGVGGGCPQCVFVFCFFVFVCFVF